MSPKIVESMIGMIILVGIHHFKPLPPLFIVTFMVALVLGNACDYWLDYQKRT